MPQWGSIDRANNSPIFAPAYVNEGIDTTNRDNLFGNTTQDVKVANLTVGVFGVSAAEMEGKGGVDSVTISDPGDGFTTLSVTFTGANDSPAAANLTALIVDETIVTHVGDGWSVGDTLQFDETGGTNTTPPNIVAATVEVVSVAVGTANGSGYAANDRIELDSGTGTNAVFNVLTVSAGSNVETLEQVSNGSYTVDPTLTDSPTANVTGSGTGLVVDVTLGLSTFTINDGGVFTTIPTNLEDNSLTDASAGSNASVNLVFGVAEVLVSSNGAGYSSDTVGITFSDGANVGSTIVLQGSGESGEKPAHTGWILRKVGTGGRAGRVQTEVLVAGGISGDASDDDVYSE